MRKKLGLAGTPACASMKKTHEIGPVLLPTTIPMEKAKKEERATLTLMV